jgi:hypothetical protein
MIISGIHGFKGWIPDYTLGNDIFYYCAEQLLEVDIKKDKQLVQVVIDRARMTVTVINGQVTIVYV